jgi:lipopolysaccharide transport system permease protein
MSKTELVIEPSSRFSLGFKELWHYRELFYFFTWRDIKVKYKQTLLGFLWVVLQPLLLMLLFMAFFSKALDITTNNVPSPIFYYTGLIIWNIFSSGLSGAAESMAANANIIKKVYFPRLVIPVSSILVALFDFLMTLAVFLPMLAYYTFFEGISFSLKTFLWSFPAALCLVVATALGAGLLLSALNVKYRDFRYVMPFFIQLSMFASPIVYPVSVYDKFGSFKYVAAFNPLAGAMELARASFSGGAIDWLYPVGGLASALLLLLLGLYVFRSTEAYFADLA